MPRRTLATFVLLVAGAVSAIATDWPQFLGPDSHRRLHRPAALGDLGRRGPEGRLAQAGRAGLRRARGGPEPRAALPSRGQRRGPRVARRTDRRDHVAVRLPDDVSRRLRLRRRTARGAGRRRRHRLHVRRPRPAARRRSRQGHARVERGHHEALQRAEGVLRRRRLSAGRRRARHRQHRRRQGGPRRLRGEDRQGALDRDRRRRQLLVRDGGDDWRPALGDLSHPRQPDRARSGDRRDALPAPLAGAQRQLGQRGDAAGGRRLDLRVGPVRPRRRRAPRRRFDAGRRLGVGRGAVESLRDERLSRRPSLRLPRPAGIRSQPPRRRVQDRHGQVEPGSVPRRQRDAGGRQAAHHARERRNGAGAGVTAGVPALARAQVLPGVVRPLPAIADGFVYVRNENTLVCLDLRDG